MAAGFDRRIAKFSQGDWTSVNARALAHSSEEPPEDRLARNSSLVIWSFVASTHIERREGDRRTAPPRYVTFGSQFPPGTQPSWNCSYGNTLPRVIAITHLFAILYAYVGIPRSDISTPGDRRVRCDIVVNCDIPKSAATPVGLPKPPRPGLPFGNGVFPVAIAGCTCEGPNCSWNPPVVAISRKAADMVDMAKYYWRPKGAGGFDKEGKMA